MYNYFIMVFCGLSFTFSLLLSKIILMISKAYMKWKVKKLTAKSNWLITLKYTKELEENR